MRANRKIRSVYTGDNPIRSNAFLERARRYISGFYITFGHGNLVSQCAANFIRG